MEYFLAKESVLKWLENPSVYHIKKDELYELDDEAFEFLRSCSAGKGCRSNDKKSIGYCAKEGILSREKSGLKRPPIKKSPVPSLRYLELQITNRCNLRCRHCYIKDKPGKELSLSLITKVLKEFEAMQGLRVLITGGEPLLHGRFKEINSILPDFFLRKILFTNGLLLNKKMLGNLNINEIQVSIDGMEKAHDSLRGKGTFRRAMRSINFAMDSGFEVSVSTMVHQKNLRDFNKMENLFKKIGIKDWTVDVPCVTGRLRENTDFQLAPKQAGKYLVYGYGGGIHSGEKGFGCGLHLMSVSASGKISKCTFYSDRAVGTIKNGLRKCWGKIKPVRLDKLECSCEHIEECRGGCRYRAEILGNAKGKDLYRCVSYKTI
ncbi:MAG: radical SAM protein [Nitrospirae bacterium]|nr:radical SAM protein [Nitrospirota bacterium]